MGRQTSTLSKLSRIALVLGALALLLAGLAPTVIAQTRLTLNPGQDTAPAWDPRGETIAYMRSFSAMGSGVPFNLYRVQSNATGESVLASGPGNPWGVANSPGWVGSTGILMTEERNVLHEYLAFDTAAAGFNRTVSDGSQGPFTRKLFVDGGGGGGFIRISRNGGTALWRASTSGGAGFTTVRVAPYASLAGQSALSSGTVLLSTTTATPQPQAFLDGFALIADGSQFVMSLPPVAGSVGRDLYLYSTAAANTLIRRLTTTGETSGDLNVQPDISHTGKVAFTRCPRVSGVVQPCDLHFINLDGTGLTNLTNTATLSEGSPSWSPEGLRLAFVRNNVATPTEPANNNIWVMDAPAANVPPVANAGPDQPAVSEGALVTLNGGASSDPNGTNLTYLWTQTAGPAAALSDPTSANPTFIAPGVGPGGAVLSFQLVVNDGLGSSPIDTVNIFVNNVNQPPVASAGAPQTVQEGQVVILEGTASYDPDGDGLTYLWTQGAGPAVVLSDANVPSPTFVAPPVTGNALPVTLTFHLVVGDAFVMSEPATVHVTVNNINQAPVADAGSSQTANEGDFVMLAGTATDPDDDALTYSWTQVAGPPVLLDGATTLTPSFVAPLVATNGVPEVVTFRLVVNDGVAHSVPAVVNVTVRNVNLAPVADTGASDGQTVNEGSLVSLDGTASYDPDSDALTYTWVQTAGPSVTLSDPTAPTPTFIAPAVGPSNAVLVFELVVNDGYLASPADTATVTVTNVNQPPVADAGVDQTVNAGTPVALNGSASSDPDGEGLTYTWTQTAGPSVTLALANTATPSFTGPAVAETTILEFQLVVSDGFAGSAPDITTVTVLNPNHPVACGSASASVALLWPPNHRMAPIGIVGVTDPDNDEVTITVTAVTQD